MGIVGAAVGAAVGIAGDAVGSAVAAGGAAVAAEISLGKDCSGGTGRRGDAFGVGRTGVAGFFR